MGGIYGLAIKDMYLSEFPEPMSDLPIPRVSSYRVIWSFWSLKDLHLCASTPTHTEL